MQNIFWAVILIVLLLAVALLAVGIIDGNRFVTVKEELNSINRLYFPPNSSGLSFILDS